MMWVLFNTNIGVIVNIASMYLTDDNLNIMSVLLENIIVQLTTNASISAI